MPEATMKIRNLRKEEMPQIIGMAASEGWNPGLHDAAAFFQVDPDGFFVGEINGVPVAYISAVRYNGRYGFVGLYIVDKVYRGRGYGLQLWNHALARLGLLTCGLDGVPAQLENYEKSGFVYAFRQMRLATPATAVSRDHYPLVECLTARHAGPIAEYDTEVFGTPRQAFIDAWMGMANAQSFGVSDRGTIVGYAVVRACVEGYKIGPLFADNQAIAEQLFLACHGAVPPGSMVYIDMPETNVSTPDWIARYNLKLVFETARMYKNGTPAFPLSKVFGVTSFELG